MIDINRMHSIGVHAYLLENQMVTGLEHRRSCFIIDFERGEKDEQNDDTKIHNSFKHSKIYKQISEELKQNRDKVEIPKHIAGNKSKKISVRKPLETQLHKQAKISMLRGSTSAITKAYNEHVKKEKIRHSIDRTLRKLRKEKRMNEQTLRMYLVYLNENFDILSADELKEDLRGIRNDFKPSNLAKHWEKIEQQKDNAKHIANL